MARLLIPKEISYFTLKILVIIVHVSQNGINGHVMISQKTLGKHGQFYSMNDLNHQLFVLKETNVVWNKMQKSHEFLR